jgi:hypothetical protein
MRIALDPYRHRPVPLIELSDWRESFGYATIVLDNAPECSVARGHR